MEYKCPKCRTQLTEKLFGNSVGFYCPTHGLVRSEIYVPSWSKSDMKAMRKVIAAANAAETEENNGSESTDNGATIDVEEKPKRRRKAKPTTDDGDGAIAGDQS